LAGPHDEHVALPDEEAEDGDGDRGEGAGGVSEDALAGEAGDDLGGDGHAGQQHDVDGGVGVEPVEVFEEGRAAALGGVEEAAVEEALDGEEDHGDGDDGCPEDHDDGRGVVGPDEEGQAAPGESRGAHAVEG
jgi:hypothetical protein